MRLIDADELLKEYDRVHVGPPGGARKLIEDAPTVSGWISVKDVVLQEETDNRISPLIDMATRWTPISEPPKEDERNDSAGTD